jgi:hypothetical protein
MQKHAAALLLPRIQTRPRLHLATEGPIMRAGWLGIVPAATMAFGCGRVTEVDNTDGGAAPSQAGGNDASGQTDAGQPGAGAAQLCPGLYRDDLPVYELDSYSGSTEGLCPAPEALCCSCLPERPQMVVYGYPPGERKVACEFAWYVWNPGAGDPSCGWHLTDSAEGFEQVLQCRICVSDSDCKGIPDGEARCTRRIANLMVCEYESEDAGLES